MTDAYPIPEFLRRQPPVERKAVERPILFSAPMILAILGGTKTQTRRALRDQNPIDLGVFTNGAHLSRRPVFDKVANAAIGSRLVPVACPYGQPGDRLVVRETFFAWGRWETRFSVKKGRDEWHFIDMTLDSGKEYRYAASMAGDNGPRQRGGVTPQWWKRPAIFMPRHASRILLEITAVRVERLQDISEADAIAEGVSQIGIETGQITSSSAPIEIGSYSAAYCDLWEQINGPGSWAENPWVWCLTFKRAAP